MISYYEAHRRLVRYCPKPKLTTVCLADGLSRVAAADVAAPVSLPLFTNSAMDGFAARSMDTRRATLKTPVRLRIRGTVRAGDNPNWKLGSGAACRIMTGAMLPDGADTVIPKERVTLNHSAVIITQRLMKGSHVRRYGEEVRRGEVVVSAGSVIHPAVVGFLSSMGITQIRVNGKPRVGIISTGSELVPPGRRLEKGKLYDSNTAMAASILKKMDITPVLHLHVKDQLERIRDAAREGLRKCDVLIMMGGVSVGDFDYVKEALRFHRVQTIFWGIRQKPGKPMFFGRKAGTFVFGLPGNPASVFTCFYEYVYPFLRRMMGFENPGLPAETLPISTDIMPDRQRVCLLKGLVTHRKNKKAVHPLSHQGSHMMSSLCRANCLIVVPPVRSIILKGCRVIVHQLPVD